MTAAPKPGHRIRWAVAIAAVLWLAPSTVSTGRIASAPLHVDAPVFLTRPTQTTRDDFRRLQAVDDRVFMAVAAAAPAQRAVTVPAAGTRPEPNSM